eukprot:13150765-Alexandrium_andersonii.AAC.1
MTIRCRRLRTPSSTGSSAENTLRCTMRGAGVGKGCQGVVVGMRACQRSSHVRTQSKQGGGVA